MRAPKDTVEKDFAAALPGCGTPQAHLVIAAGPEVTLFKDRRSGIL